tara:strand:+ start:496 stop:1299 length:804 start_codon:yes stop_codon:yes gene_type:complete
MKFSILISSYNKGEHLEECIKSCLVQKEENFEVILFDNESTDKSNEILEKYLDRIRIIKRKKISNHPALNQIDLISNAFKISSGSIICLLDADDYFDSNKLDSLKKIFSQETEIDCIFDLPILKYKNHQRKFILKKKLQKNIWPSIIPTSGISCRRNFFEYFMNNSLENKYSLLEIDFRLNVVSRSLDKKFKIIKEDLTFYRQTDNSMMSGIKKLSLIWWKKRYEAHRFMNDLFLKHDKKYNNKFDFYISKFISSLSENLNNDKKND